MGFEDRLSVLEKNNQRLDSKWLMMEERMMGMQEENRSLKDYFVQLLKSCETISNHEEQFSELKKKFGRFESTSETCNSEIELIKSNLDALLKYENIHNEKLLESFDYISNHKKQFLEMKAKFGSLETTCETYDNEIKYIKNHLDVFEKSEVKLTEKQKECDITIGQLNEKFDVLEVQCKTDMSNDKEQFSEIWRKFGSLESTSKTCVNCKEPSCSFLDVLEKQGENEIQLNEQIAVLEDNYKRDDGDKADDDDEKEGEIAKFEMKVQGLLNSLGYENSWTLLPIDTEEQLSLVVVLVFEKAMSDASSAEYCARVSKSIQMRKVAMDDGENYVNFRKLLVSKCQREFEKDCIDDLDRDQFAQDINKAKNEEMKSRIKAEFAQVENKLIERKFGVIQFIGQLYKLDMLTGRIIHECVKKLLYAADEDSIECLCKLLTCVFKELSQETQGRLAKGPQIGILDVSVYLDMLSKLLTEKNFSPRVKCLIKGVIHFKPASFSTSFKK